MKNANSAKLLSAALTILVGVLFLIWKGTIISVAMTVIGVLLIVSAIVNLARKRYTVGVVGAVFGVMVLCFGWLFLSVALYVLAAILLIYGILLLIEIARRGLSRIGVLAAIVRLSQPIICILVAGCLLFNQGGAVDWVFILSGIFLIVEGVLALGDAIGLK